MNDIQKMTVSLLELERFDLSNKDNLNLFNKTVGTLSMFAAHKAFTLLPESAIDEYEKLPRLSNPQEDAAQLVNFLLSKGIDFKEIYREEVIKYRIELKKADKVKESSEAKEEFFNDLVLDPATEVLGELTGLSKTGAFAADVGSLGVKAAYDPARKYESKKENKRKIINKVTDWIAYSFGVLIFDFLLYGVVFLLHKNQMISAIPEWLNEATPDFVISIVHHLLT